MDGVVVYEPIDPRFLICRQIARSSDVQRDINQRHIDQLNELINTDPAFEKNSIMFREMLKALGSSNLILPHLIEFHTEDGYWKCDFDFRTRQLVFFFKGLEDSETLQSPTSLEDLAFQLHQDLQRNGRVEVKMIFPETGPQASVAVES